MSLTSGQRLGAYQIVDRLGAGGMGEVYRATDTKLGREVAIKGLPADVAQDSERLGRFRREAQLLASLNHPNIGAIYGLEETGGTPLLVLELVSGEDLAERLRRGPIPVAEALEIGRQIAEALEEAHEKGIVHRDLKPANIKLTPDGKVKVLDFGLAKALSQDLGTGSVSKDLSQSPTLAQTGTRLGVILGTAAYMSPEQAAGKAVDRRADVWAFGAVLFEMLTGRPLFAGETASEVLASVIKEEPDWSRLPSDCPAVVERLLRRCLRKRPRERLHDMGDARLEIEEALSGSDDALAATRPALAGTRSRRRPLLWGAGGIALLLAAGVGIGLLVARPRPDERVVAFEVSPPQGTSFYLHSERPGVPVVSPDGRMLAFTAEAEGKYRLYVRPFNTTVAHPLPGTEGAQYHFWSPDSRHLGFFADHKLKKVQVAGGGGPPVALCDAPEVKGASWSPRGVIVFAPDFNTPLHRVSDAGGESTAVTRLDAARKEDSHRHPRFLPDGRHFLYLARVSGGSSDNTVVVGSLDGGEGKTLLRSPAAAEFASGHLLFLRERTLMARPFDPDRLEFTDEAFPVAEDVRLIAPATALAVFSASQTGVLAYEQGGAGGDRRLVWRDRQGRETGVLGDEAPYFHVRLSPRGDMALVTLGPGNGDVWIYEIARNLRTRLTFTPQDEWAGAWSPDSKSVFFSSNRHGNYDLYRATVGAAEREEVVYASDRTKLPSSVSPDGRLLCFSLQHPDTSWDVWILPLEGERKPYPVVQTSSDEAVGVFSPDGRWLAYHSNESGRQEVYVTPFPGPGRKWQVSTRGGLWAVWQRDGKEIFYHEPGGSVMAAAVEVRGEGLVFGAPRPLFPLETQETNFRYSAAPDGQRFMAIEQVRAESSRPLTVVVNWTATLRD